MEGYFDKEGVGAGGSCLMVEGHLDFFDIFAGGDGEVGSGRG